MQGLAHFLNKETQVEAILVNFEEKKLTVATLGPVNYQALQERLRVTLKQIEDTLKEESPPPLHAVEDLRRIAIRPMPGQTLLEKATCMTAPKLWTWRDLEWYEPKIHEDHGPEDWRFLAVLAGLCGLLGLMGVGARVLEAPSWISFGFFILSMVAGGWEAATDVIHNVPKGKLDIHFLMLSVAIGATAIGAWQEGALLLFLFSFSGALEHFALHRTHQSIDKLLKLAPKTATVVGEKGEETQVPIDKVNPGACLLIKPGDLFPLDAEVLSGTTGADESTLTGEATPISKAKGDTVYSGTLNLWGVVYALALRPAKESALQKIIKLIQEAKHLKAKSQIFTDRFGTPYTYAVLATTTVMFLIWWLGMGLEPFLNTPESHSAFYRAMALLVVASPCALVLSIPSAILAAIAWGAHQGILFRGGAAVEKLAELTTVALDKTGTLTTGNLEVCKVESFPEGAEDQVLRLAYALEKNANHPIARAIVRYAKQRAVEVLPVSQFQSLVGKGLKGYVGQEQCILGRRELLALGPFKEWLSAIPHPEEGFTEVWVVQAERLGRILLKDTLRPESKAVLQALKQRGLHTVMLTGDHSGAAQKVGKALGIEDIQGGLSPEEKVRAIQKLSQHGNKVAMIGDGVNDAPSLAAAYVSVAMGARGSDAALEQSEVILMHDRIENFLEAYELSLAAKKIIHQNLFISLGTIVVMVFSASFGWVPLSLGVFAHEGSTVLVCLNSLRLLFKKRCLSSQKNPLVQTP